MASDKKQYYNKYYTEHREEILARGREYHRKNRTARLAKQYDWRKKQKEDVLSYYGKGICACVRCGYNDIRALSIDHIEGDGKLHRDSTGNNDIYRWLVRNNYPEGYQTLCMNCQYVKRAENREYSKREEYINQTTLPLFEKQFDET